MINIAIRDIQHYLYCAHRWGLIEIGRVWEENYFVTKANLLHERVHDGKYHYLSGDKMMFHSVSVYLDKAPYNIYGVTDCIEAVGCSSGNVVFGNQKYNLNIIEHKPSKPKNGCFNEDDLMQVFAQKLCADNVFNTNCGAYIYYADVKKRVKLPIQENFSYYDEKLKSILSEMRMYAEKGIIPPVSKGQKCSGCSFINLCMPKTKVCRSIRDFIRAESQL